MAPAYTRPMFRGLPRSALGPFAGFAAFGVLFGAWAALIPLVQEEVGASRGELGLALLFVGLGTLPAMLVAGPALNRYGPRLQPVTLLALAAVAVLPAFAGSVMGLALLLIAWGAAAGAVDVAINGAAADVEVRTGARIMQLAHGLFSLGVLVGALAAGVAREAGAGRLAILGGVSVVLAAAALASRDLPGRSEAAVSSSRVRVRRRFVLLGLVCLAAFLVEGGIENWSALFVERDLDATPLVGALGPAAYALAMVAGRFSGQLVTGRVPDRALLAGGAVVTIVGLAIAASATVVPLALLGFFLGGAGVSVAAPVAFSAAGRGSSEEERGSALATVTTLGYMGLMLGPPIAGGVAEFVGLRATFLALGAIAATIALVAPRLDLTPRAAPRERAASEAI